jgi:hypothetical protein
MKLKTLVLSLLVTGSAMAGLMDSISGSVSTDTVTKAMSSKDSSADTPSDKKTEKATASKQNAAAMDAGSKMAQEAATKAMATPSK